MSRLIRHPDHEETERWFFNTILHDIDYAVGGPGILPDWYWWRFGIERNGLPRRPEHDEWVEYVLDANGNAVTMPPESK